MKSKTTIVFPGQGSQIVGMGQDIAQAYKEARNVFEEINEALSQDLAHIIFKGPLEDLTLTTNTQPALMAVSIAIVEVLKKQISFSIKDQVSYCAGHSLGEYTALTAADSFNIETSAKILRVRGSAMQDASPLGQGAMAALIGVNIEEAEKLANSASQGEVCQVANDNTIGQVVVSGHKSAIERLIKITQEQGKKAIILPVSAPFHSSLMAKATKIMSQSLEEIKIAKPSVPIIANVSAKPLIESHEIKDHLVKQVEGRVRWRESILFLIENGIDHFIEIGAGKVLSGLIKKINPDVKITNINNLETLNYFMENH